MSARFTDEYTSTLRKWVNMATPTKDRERLNAFLDSLCEAFSFAEIKRIDTLNGDVVHIVCGEGERRALLCGHADTVFPADSFEKFDIENNRAYGAGVLDMKSGLFMMKKAMEGFCKSPVPGWRLEAVITPDEESGSGESFRLIEEIAKGAEFALVLEASPEGCVTVRRKGVYRFAIRIRGVSSHASGGDKGRKSAVFAMSEILNALYSMKNDGDTTLHIGIARGGSAANVVAKSALIEGEIRSFDAQTLEEILEKIRGLLTEGRDTLEILSRRPPMPGGEKTEKLFGIARKAGEAAGLVLTPRAASGGSDGAFLARAGVPVLDGMGPEGGGSHTGREYVKLETLEKRFEAAYQTLMTAMRCDFR